MIEIKYPIVDNECCVANVTSILPRTNGFNRHGMDVEVIDSPLPFELKRKMKWDRSDQSLRGQEGVWIVPMLAMSLAFWGAVSWAVAGWLF
jgi:hypothetical protein